MNDIVNYERFLYKMETDNDELDIFYLFFGITRQILWEISPELKITMIQRQ